MAIQQAQAAATPEPAATQTVADNPTQQQDSAAERAAILQQMNDAASKEPASEEVVDPNASPAVDPDSSLEAEPDPDADPDAITDPDPDAVQDPDGKPNAKNFRGRWDHLDEQERRVVELTTKRGLSLEEAYRAVYGDAKAPGKQAAEPQPDPIAAVDAEIQQTEGAIASLEKQIEEAQFDPAEQTSLRKQLAQEAKKLGRLEAKKESVAEGQKAQAQQQVQSAKTDSEARIFASFPDAFVESKAGQFGFNTDTELGQAALAEYQYLEATGSQLLSKPNGIELLVNRVARQLGIKPTTPAAKPAKTATPSPAATPPAAAARRTARPVATGGNPPPNPTLEAKTQKALSSGSKEEILEAMREAGTPLWS